MSSNDSSQVIVKVMIIGNPSVGKTSLLMRFIENRFSYSTIGTIGIDFREKNYSYAELTKTENTGPDIRLQIWDSSGQDQFKNITQSFFRQADGFILVYDITDLASYTSLIAWLQNIERLCHKQIPVVILGNKMDLENRRVIDSRLAKNFADSHCLEYYEVSAAKNEDNRIQQVIDQFALRSYIAKRDYKPTVTGSFYLRNSASAKSEPVEAEDKCC